MHGRRGFCQTDDVRMQGDVDVDNGSSEADMEITVQGSTLADVLKVPQDGWQGPSPRDHLLDWSLRNRVGTPSTPHGIWHLHDKNAHRCLPVKSLCFGFIHMCKLTRQ